MYKRCETRKIKVGNIFIGGQNKVVIQSMTDTKTKDIKKTVEQILELEKVGCEIVRVACLDIEDAKSIKEIKKRISIPIVADIHFDYNIALTAIENGADKIRINPGNIGSIERVKKVVNACKEKNIPIRIGINGGSLEPDLEKKYGVSAKAMVESCKRHIKILEDLDFYDICISLKSSDPKMVVEAYFMISEIYNYPLHIGITEAGSLISSSVKSAIYLGKLLEQGLGDTIRVSITGSVIDEVKVAKEILQSFDLKDKPKLVSCPTCGRCRVDLKKYAKEVENYLDTIDSPITVAVMGCSVNGINEAKHADIGMAGMVGSFTIFKDKKIIKQVKEDEAVNELIKEIEKIIKR